MGNPLAFLSLSFFICTMGTVMPTSQGLIRFVRVSGKLCKSEAFLRGIMMYGGGEWAVKSPLSSKLG